MPGTDQSGFYDLFEEPGNKLLFAVAVGLFLSLFMIVFQPFGVTNYDPDFKINATFVLLLLSLGAFLTLVLLISEFVLRPRVLRVDSPARIAAWLGWVYLLTGSTVFLLYNAVGGWHDFSLRSWLAFLPDVSLVISFPLAAFLFYLRHQALRTDLIRLESLSSPRKQPGRFSFTSENGKDALVVAAVELLYLESEDNYVGIRYAEDGNIRNHLVRSTLKRLEEQLEESSLLRCHRSFIVNLDRVTSCRGNRHGLRLKLDGMDGIVPVSRRYVDVVLRRMKTG